MFGASCTPPNWVFIGSGAIEGLYVYVCVYIYVKVYRYVGGNRDVYGYTLPQTKMEAKRQAFSTGHISFPYALEKDRVEGWTSEETKESLPPKVSRIGSGTEL